LLELNHEPSNFEVTVFTNVRLQLMLNKFLKIPALIFVQCI